MIDIENKIKKIEKLLSDNTIESSTYAALECRMSLEKICYDRFVEVHKNYQTEESLKSWQPKDVIQEVLKSSSPYINTDLVISIQGSEGNYLKLGTQKEINLNKLGRLWNAISNVALHTSICDSQIYGNKEKIDKKIKEILKFLEPLKKHTLSVAGNIGDNYKFECDCGIKNSIPLSSIKNGIEIDCFNKKCNDSYKLSIINEDNSDLKPEIQIIKREYGFICGCGQEIKIGMNNFKRVRAFDETTFHCDKCKKETEFKLIAIPTNGNLFYSTVFKITEKKD